VPRLDDAIEVASQIARALASEVAEFGVPQALTGVAKPDPPLEPASALLSEYDRRITDNHLRTATRSRFVSTHYADAVEAGVKALNELVRARTGSTQDGDELMTATFSVTGASSAGT